MVEQQAHVEFSAIENAITKLDVSADIVECPDCWQWVVRAYSADDAFVAKSAGLPTYTEHDCSVEYMGHIWER